MSATFSPNGQTVASGSHNGTAKLWDVESGSRNRIIRTVAVLLVLLVLPPLVMIGWMQSWGVWQLSASNAPDGVDVDVYWGNADSPQYSTTLVGHSILRDLVRITREQVPQGVGTATFSDTTMRRGRWTIVIDGVELDIMESGWTVDRGW